MNKLIFIPLLCLIAACGNRPKENNSASTQAPGTGTVKKTGHDDGVAGKSKMDDLREKLTGIWSDSVGGNAVFQISKKTFFYVDNNTGYTYKFIGDSINVHYDGYYENFGWKFKGKDTLV